MTPRSVNHATFVIERHFNATPARVFRAYADPGVKRLWFHGPEDWQRSETRLDFRVGGTEVERGGPAGGPIHAFEARFQDIVPDQRIIFSYDMHLEDVRISVSLATVELAPEDNGTHMTFTEQAAFLDGYEDAGGREHGTRELLAALDVMLTQSADQY